MRNDRKFKLTIYHNGVHFEAHMHGKKRFLMERAFLDDLVAPKFGRHARPRPIPDPASDFYELTDEELAAYSAFRHKLDGSEGSK
jgi:hypothetical protein